MNRRDFLLKTGALAAGAMLPADALAADARAPAAAAARQGTGPVAGAGGSVAILRDPADAVAAAEPVRRAVERLRRALSTRGYVVRLLDRPGDARPDEQLLVLAGAASPLARAADVRPPAEPESLAIAPGRLGERAVTFAAGSDALGLVYALAEIADAVALGEDPNAALRPAQPTRERPANRVRSVMRLFVSDVEDLPWYTDRGFWRMYLARLVDQRFNRVNLALGLGYDTPEGLADTYFYFAYPFLVDVRNVRATYLPTRERDRNLELLRFMSDEAAAVGLDFQLGLWTHAYRWVDSPHANHEIEGLTPASHASYCRAALEVLLRQCPNITGVTLRIHGESGVPEGSYGFWRTIFEGCARAGRPVRLDLHAKGMDQPTLDAALAVGLPLTISPKFWAEHMGLPYHQAAIRPTELPGGSRGRGGAFSHSEGDRSFTRYGYGDLLREDRRYAVVERLWPGTQRVLLWGDPAFAAAYSGASSFCGMDGCELMEPLSFKGRKGSGTKAGRDGYADAALRAPGGDFEKYELTYRLWGRLLYDPDAAPAVWQRRLRADYGRELAPAVETALSHASRILPLLTTAHLPSAANNHFWPEMYVNMAIADPNEPVMPYPDTPQPRRFGTVSPLDPQLFATVEELAGELLAGRRSGKYSPVEVAQWLEDLAATAGDAVARATPATAGDAVASGHTANRSTPAFRRFAADTGAAIGLGRFFAQKLRAAVLFALYDRTGDKTAQAAAVRTYQSARDEYARVAASLTGVYKPDLTYGPAWYQRGHWQDRLAAIDGDISAVRVAAVTASAPTPPERVATLVAEVLARPERRATPASHAPPPAFARGRPVPLQLTLPGGDPRRTVTLHYRITHQAEAWRSLPMPGQGDVATAAIPGDYTDTPYPLQYYFEVAEPSGRAWLYPGLGEALTRQPYFVVRQAR